MSAVMERIAAVRPLAARDLEAVAAIDAALGGRSRRAYFERRLAAARRDPEGHVQFAVDAGGTLAGYILGRALEGEFGRSEPELRIETLGVHPASQRRGIGRRLAEAFAAEGARRGAAAIRTTASWREHELLCFLEGEGYRLATAGILERALEPGVDFDAEARDAWEVRTLREDDIDGIARIDRRVTGRQRRGYLCRALAETLTDGVRVSLAAGGDGAVAGFVMARVDYGDFGRLEPVAVIDSIGVDPMQTRQGIGRALLSQLFMNLGALGVERVETVVAWGDAVLAGFFHAAGFRPSQRLAFVKLSS
jgi:ribosomal protein S18 acetylase RimI-like enzyme